MKKQERNVLVATVLGMMFLGCAAFQPMVDHSILPQLNCEGGTRGGFEIGLGSMIPQYSRCAIYWLDNENIAILAFDVKAFKDSMRDEDFRGAIVVNTAKGSSKYFDSTSEEAKDILVRHTEKHWKFSHAETVGRALFSVLVGDLGTQYFGKILDDGGSSIDYRLVASERKTEGYNVTRGAYGFNARIAGEERKFSVPSSSLNLENGSFDRLHASNLHFSPGGNYMLALDQLVSTQTGQNKEILKNCGVEASAPSPNWKKLALLVKDYQLVVTPFNFN